MAALEPLANPRNTVAADYAPRWKWLPAVNSWKYHLLLGAIGILVLGPLGGVTASFMNFSLGFFVGGQVLAGILGSTITYGYGAEGKHGANYIQTTAASVAGMSAVAFAKLFMAAYPVLLQDQTVMSASVQPTQWTSAMTYKFVGALRSLTDAKPYQHTAILVGIALGFATEFLRKLIAATRRYRDDVRRSGPARAVDFTIFAVILPSPYASSFGGFVNLPTACWFAAGSVIAEAVEWIMKRRGTAHTGALPSDMSVTSLVGGGFIAGDAIAALGIGMYGLVNALIAA
jgi:hypothetical protein